MRIEPGPSVCILHAGALGDCVLTLHVANALRRGGHAVTLIARSPIAAWAARRKLIDQFIWLDRVQWLWRKDAAASDPANSSDAQPLRSFDVLVSFLGCAGDEVSDRLERACGPGRVVHVDPKPTQQSIRDGTHITQQWISQIAKQIPHLSFESHVSSPNDHRVQTLNVLVHPGSGGRAKCCPLDAMETLVAELKRRGAAVKWMIGPDEMERDGPALRERLARTARVVFEESIEKAADLVARTDTFIGNDSGITHVAGLTGVTTVALFGPTDSRVWGPLGPRCHVHRFPEANEPVETWLVSLIAGLGP